MYAIDIILLEYYIYYGIVFNTRTFYEYLSEIDNFFLKRMTNSLNEVFFIIYTK